MHDFDAVDAQHIRDQRTGRMANRPDGRGQGVSSCNIVACLSRAVHSSIDLVQRRALVHGYMLSLVALDLVLRLIFTGVTWMAFVLGVAGVDPDDPAAHMPGFRIPSHVIANFELRAHTHLPPSRQRSITAAGMGAAARSLAMGEPTRPDQHFDRPAGERFIGLPVLWSYRSVRDPGVGAAADSLSHRLISSTSSPSTASSFQVHDRGTYL
jgi:hypothetical protein